jgi:DNA-binding MarR family transcriptional regulator
MTAAVDRLEEKGPIKRGSAPSDRRTKVLHLTPEGRRVVERVAGIERRTGARRCTELSGDAVQRMQDVQIAAAIHSVNPVEIIRGRAAGNVVIGEKPGTDSR